MLLNKFKAANRPSWAEDIWKIAFSAGCVHDICSLVISLAFFFFWYSKLLELSSAHNFGYSGIGLWFELVVWWLAFVCVCVCAVLFCSFLHDSFLLGFVFIAVFWGGGEWAETTSGQYGKDITVYSNWEADNMC